MKEKYIEAELEIVEFENEDIVTASGSNNNPPIGDVELPDVE